MKCPVCRATYRATNVGGQKPAIGEESPSPDFTPTPLNCRRCGVDLTPLIHLHDQAVWHHRQAIQAFQAGDYSAAIAQNNQALALHAHQADFHALAGQLWALQGDFAQAIAAWKIAHDLNPQHLTTTTYLQHLEAIASSANHPI
ncbi:hypothetical protein H6G89_02580 [Oscillatoria sp. FACHB-1407]|uniref:hypothetical protein n=1 Tax=Oscillatoria sp. FACHB-1407 TaxID=2692847 RepID=UPI001689B3D4|nr:hypothetical protein [Oscillatoria sp. FACHB-1407]MBD2459921.1 hypothetical protein [Oscillatoria sp. FACHB-1407]